MERIKTGVEGLDELVDGGIIKGEIILLAGSTGSGKTILSTQFIYNGAKLCGEKGVYATFEEDEISLKRNMAKLGMDLAKLEAEGKVKIIGLQSMKEIGLNANLDFILKSVKELEAERLIVDSLTAFLTGTGEKFEYRTLMHLFYKILKKMSCTTVMTCSVPAGSETLGLGIEEFIADSVIVLENVIVDTELKTRFLIRKMRGTSHSRTYHDVIIGENGLKIVPFSTM
jgi:circadian clock protein KaiC